MAQNDCPCCSRKSYEQCCQRFHDGDNCPTTEDLLRPRFSAFVLNKKDFLIRTHHPFYITPNLITDLEDSSFEPFDLVINDIDGGSERDLQGSISYAFKYKNGHKTVRFATRSLYSKLGEEWFYEKDA